MNEADEERLSFLLRTKPFKVGNILDITDHFKIDDVYSIRIDTRAQYFDVTFLKGDIELEIWMYYSNQFKRLIFLSNKKSGELSSADLVEMMMEKHQPIFEWILFHPELFELPERQ
mgnify:CR=1 FL=1